MFRLLTSFRGVCQEKLLFLFGTDWNQRWVVNEMNSPKSGKYHMTFIMSNQLPYSHFLDSGSLVFRIEGFSFSSDLIHVNVTAKILTEIHSHLKKGVFAYYTCSNGVIWRHTLKSACNMRSISFPNTLNNQLANLE